MESAFLSRSSSTQADPLSEVLSLIQPRGYMAGGIDAGGEWAFRFAPDNLFRCFSIVSGSCWLTMDGIPAPVALSEGEFLVLPHGRGFCVASHLGLPPVDILSVVTTPLQGRILRWNGGGGCLALSAVFTFAGQQSGMLLRVLPASVHIRSVAARAAMRWCLERMMAVTRDRTPGSTLLGEHLAQILLIEVLRLHLADDVSGGVGWLFALADPQIGTALAAIHGDPARRWTLTQLAEHTAMSRSAFALRFKQKVGTSAMDYLTQWRMLLAADRLTRSSDSIAAIASSLGYESESSFSFAFRREMGASPRQYGRKPAASTGETDPTAFPPQ